MIFAEIASDYPPKIMPIGHSVRFVGLIFSPFARYLLDTPAVHWPASTGLLDTQLDTRLDTPSHLPCIWPLDLNFKWSVLHRIDCIYVGFPVNPIA